MALPVQLRGGYSDRTKIKPINTVIQYSDFDARSRTMIINEIDLVFNIFSDTQKSRIQQQFFRDILSDIYAQEINHSKIYLTSDITKILYETLRHDSYDAVLTVVEYLVLKAEKLLSFNDITSHFNQLFETEFIGYRFVNKQITPITDKNEIETIEESMQTKHAEVSRHLSKALALLSDRDTPDYANSIKESISAVERMCSIIIGTSTTLGVALKQLESKGTVIHPSLKLAFEKLFGYTSDSSGIRHAGQLGGADATFEEAKFMLVACSGFINYLTGVIAKLP